MTRIWSEQVSRYLLDFRLCPRCSVGRVTNGVCPHCRADLTGDIGADLAAASVTASDAIAARWALIELLPTATAAAPVPLAPRVAPTATPRLAPQSRSQVTLQSVLAIAGAGMFAVAAIVFTFFNPDLTDIAVRNVIVGVVSVVFLAGALLLARADLQFSAEAVGALGMVFVALDIRAIADAAPPSVNGWFFVAAATLVSSVILIALAVARRLRTWLWTGLVGLAITPAFLGYAFDNHWVAIAGHLAVGAVSLGAFAVATRLAARFDGSLRADRVTLTVIQLLVPWVVLIQLALLTDRDAVARTLGAAAAFVALALLAAAATRTLLPRVWSVLAGVFGVGAIAVLPFALQVSLYDWLLALLPPAAGVGAIVIAFIPRVLRIDRVALLSGALGVLALMAMPAALYIAQSLLSAQPRDRFETPQIAASVGLSLASISAVVIARFSKQATIRGIALAGGLWLGVVAALGFVAWTAIVPGARIAIGLVLAVSLSLAAIRRLSTTRLRMRVPVIVGAHLLLILVTAISWSNDSLTVIGGTATLLALAVVARALPASVRFLYVGAGFAYALVVFAHGLTLVHVESIATLCLTTTLASVVGLVATLARRIGARSWYAILVVTIIPFLIGVLSLLFERSGWTALSTAVIFALALTLLVTRRTGLNRYLRATAAALLVPALAVVVICLGAQLLASSGSPIALPVIAVIIAVVLPLTARVEQALVTHGLTDEEARFATLAIEGSSALTAVLAVLLALVRAAAGLDTSFWVLVVLGIGAATSATLNRRTSHWVSAFAAWTGALWCFWGIIGIDVIEPYVLPPALACAIIGAIVVARRQRGIWLYRLGLGVATLAPLLALAAGGNGIDALIPWRSLGLLVGAAAVITFARLGMRTRLGALRGSTLIAGIVASAAGSIQAVRLGFGLDGTTALLPMVLAFTAAAAVIAVLGGRWLSVTSRWIYVPAAVYAVVGPISSVRHDWFSIWTLWAMTALLLALMILTVVRAGRTSLPPVWVTFGLAWFTAVAGWSQRELRVEVFSLLLGVGLVTAGVLALGANSGARGTVTSWPIGFRGSWRVLAPGIVVGFLPSLLSTGTDPQTWRAILVIVLALATILVGSVRKLAAPFVIGLIILPIENAIVFIVQLSRGIGSTPWWITLATGGAVLLVIAVTSERRTSSSGGLTARLRDLT